jgi:hypothetical protein
VLALLALLASLAVTVPWGQSKQGAIAAALALALALAHESLLLLLLLDLDLALPKQLVEVLVA